MIAAIAIIVFVGVCLTFIRRDHKTVKHERLQPAPPRRDDSDLTSPVNVDAEIYVACFYGHSVEVDFINDIRISESLYIEPMCVGETLAIHMRCSCGAKYKITQGSPEYQVLNFIMQEPSHRPSERLAADYLNEMRALAICERVEA